MGAENSEPDLANPQSHDDDANYDDFFLFAVVRLCEALYKYIIKSLRQQVDITNSMPCVTELWVVLIPTRCPIGLS